MKKLFYVLALASFSFVACNSADTKADAPAADTTAAPAPAPVADTTAAAPAADTTAVAK